MQERKRKRHVASQGVLQDKRGIKVTVKATRVRHVSHLEHYKTKGGPSHNEVASNCIEHFVI